MTIRRQEIERLSAPQLRFDALRAAAGARAARGLADLSYANAWDGPPAEVREILTDALDERRPLDLQYTPYGGSTITRRIVAESLDAGLHYRDVVLTPGAMAVLNVVFRQLQDAEDEPEVLVITPCWMDVPLYLANLGLRTVTVGVDPESLRLDLDAIRSSLTPRTRAVVLCQPANPVGLVHGHEELEALAAILNEAPSKPLWISDECHRDFVFPGTELISPLELYDRTVVVYSFGKAFALQGQRIGYAAVSPRMEGGRELAQRYEELCRIMGFCTPTALMQLAVRRLVDCTPNLDPLIERRARALAVLRAAGYDVVPSEATFFLYPRVPHGDGFSFCEELSRRGLLVLPAELFHGTGHFRLSLTCTDAMLDRGLEILGTALDQKRPA